MTDYIRIKQALYCEPVMITPEAHRVICETFENHIAGQPQQAGILEQFEAEPPKLEAVDGVGIAQIEGVIARKISNLERGCGACGVEDVRGLVDQFMQRDDLTAMVLVIDSPGGSGMGTPEVAGYIREAAKVKPIIAYADGLMASAAYYLAAGCTAVYASQSAMVGSIGTYIALLDESRRYEMAGVKVEMFKDGDLKAAGFPGTSLSEDQREQLQGLVNELNAQFTGFVSDARGGIADEVMQGQVFTAQTAMMSGLVDSIASLEQTLADARFLGMSGLVDSIARLEQTLADARFLGSRK